MAGARRTRRVRLGGVLLVSAVGALGSLACGAGAPGIDADAGGAGDADDSAAADAPEGSAADGGPRVDGVAAPDSTSPDAGQDAGGCNGVANAGAVVTVVAAPGSLPSGAGGALAPGAYVLTDVRVYAQDAGALLVGHTFRQTTVLTTAPIGFDYQSATSFDGAPSTVAAGGFDVSGSSLTITETCPQSSTQLEGYTFDPASKRLQVLDPPTNSEFVFVLQ